MEREEISVPKLVPELKMKISCLISLEIVRKGRPFSDGVVIKQLLKKNFGNTNFIESLPLSDKTVARRTLQL